MVNRHAPTNRRTTIHESLQGAFGIPEFNRLFGDGTFTVNRHAPTNRRTTIHESLQGAFGIPEFMPPIRRRTFTVKKYGRFRRYAGIAAVLAVSLVFPLVSGAAEKPADMEEADWALLQDNVLEYQELEDRIRYFNPTLQQIVKSINESYDTVHENIVDYQEAANDFERLYEEAIEQRDFMSAYMYQVNKKIARRMSSNYIKAEKQKEDTIEKSTKQYRKMFTSGCQQLMLAYNKMAVNKATLEKQVELYQAMEGLSGTQSGIGMATQTDLLSAHANLVSAQTTLTSLEDQMASVKSSLLLMTGWDYNTPVQIGTIPKADVSQIDEIDFAADKQMARSNNYTLIEMKNAPPNDIDGDGRYANKDYAARERGVDQATQQLSITVDSLYETLFEKRAALQAADTALQAAQLKWDGANVKFQLGMLGRAEFLGEEIAYYAAKAAWESADLDMTQALLNYYWGINGLGELAN